MAMAWNSGRAWRMGRGVGRFGRDEDGGMTILGLFLLLLMLMVGGICVDIMRHETTRARLQATLDRSVLAAAALGQQRDPEAVVRDYFAKADMSHMLRDVVVEQGVNARWVSATASVVMDTFFMKFSNMPTLTVPASGAAVESRSDIEVVLVLDVSGSMSERSGSTTKIALLRAAAAEFVQTIRENDSENRVSIALVPFNAQVNLGPTLFNALVAEGYNLTHQHGAANSFCLDMPAPAFTTPSLSRSLALPQAGWFDGSSGTTQNANFVAPQGISAGSVFCRVEPQNFVRPPSQDIATLRSQAQALSANGNTSITMGMEWGLFLLDPATRPYFNRLIAQGAMPATLSGRPFDLGRQNTRKIIVVMTDGEHVSSQLLDDSFRTQSTADLTAFSSRTPIYRASDGRYSIRHDVGRPSGTPAGHMYWVPHLSAWHWRAWNGTAPDPIPNACNPNHALYNEAACARVPAGLTALRWSELWAQLRVQWVAWQLYGRALGTNGSTRTNVYNLWMDRFINNTDVANMNATLAQSCSQARDNGVVVYGIAFEAPRRGQEVIHNCASSSAHYFDAQGLEIQTAFRSIAAQINVLRLSQ